MTQASQRTPAQTNALTFLLTKPLFGDNAPIPMQLQAIMGEGCEKEVKEYAAFRKSVQQANRLTKDTHKYWTSEKREDGSWQPTSKHHPSQPAFYPSDIIKEAKELAKELIKKAKIAAKIERAERKASRT